MKYLTIILSICLIALSCNKTIELPDPCAELLDCTGTCEFTLAEQTATTVFLSCYDEWGVLYDGEEYPVGLIIDNMPSQYKQDSMQLLLCGYARTNTIPLKFPDPNVGAVYQFEAVYLEAVQ